MKKYLTIIFAALLLVGCGNKPVEETQTKQEETKQPEMLDLTKKDEEKPEKKLEEKKQDTLDLTNKEENTSSDDIIEIGKTISFDKFDITITNIEKVKDYEDKPALKITYTWTNNGDKTAAPFMTFTLKGFQDGVETDSWVMADAIDLGIGQKEIKPGATIENCEAGVMITDESKPIDIELSESFSFSNKVYSMTLNPNEL